MRARADVHKDAVLTMSDAVMTVDPGPTIPLHTRRQTNRQEAVQSREARGSALRQAARRA
ncbi:MAG: hypothetical protein JWM62_857 [Frankiales bacterium]|jgi:hypothetical protein|nr:hypothetical protein [Frankiales bacterium]